MSKVYTKQSAAELRDKYQAFFVVLNVLSMLLFVPFAKCLCDMRVATFHTISITFGIAYTASFVLLLNFSESKLQSLDNSELRRKVLSQLIQLSSYLKELPLAFIAFYYFTHVFYMKTTTSFQYYYLLIVSALFSAIGILNCIIAERFMLTISFSLLRLFFLFKFRWFFFVARVIGLATFLASFNGSTDFVIFIFTIYVLVQFVAYFLCFWFFCDKPSQFTSQRVLHRLLKATFESTKLLIDFNDKYFKSKRVLFKLCGFSLTVNLVKLLGFGCFQVGSQVFFAYFWYIRAMLAFKADQSKTTLFSLLTKVRTRINLVNLYELEIKLKHRQLELITISGCLVIAALSYHIFYTYYNKQNVELAKHVGIVESPGIKKRSLDQDEIASIERARKSIDDKRLGFIEDKIDGFSIDTYQQSSSIATSISSDSFMSPKYKSHKSLNHLQAKHCSTCSSYDDDDSSYTETSQSFSSILMTPLEKNLKRSLFRSQSLSCKRQLGGMKFNSMPRSRAYEYDSSSGVDSSTTGSRSTVFDYNDLNYLKNCQVTPSTYQTERFLGPNRVEFTVGNLNKHNSQASIDDKDFGEKVKVWFSRKQEVTCNLNSTFRFSAQDVNRLSESYVI